MMEKWQSAFTAKPIFQGSGDGGISSCKTGACPPTVNSDGDGTLMLEARGGAVTFKSSECGATDLCELAQAVDAMMEKFDPI